MKIKKFNLAVTSREYKLILNPGKFKNRIQALKRFNEMLAEIVDQISGHYNENAEEEKRITWYLDTKHYHLLGKSYILRIREEEDEKKKYKISIKHRHPDRYISASKDLGSPEECETKFEEDITSPFISKFSHSTCVKTDSLKNLERVKHLLDLFPDLDVKDHEDKKLKIVNGFKAYEISCRIGSFYFEDETPIKACVNFWYDNDKYIGKPLVAEFSFDYDIDDHKDPRKKLEKYSGRIVHNCHLIFNKLQNNRDWLADSGTGKTKTDIAYGKAREKLFNSKLESIIN